MTQAARKSIRTAPASSLEALYSQAEFDRVISLARSRERLADADALIYVRALLKEHAADALGVLTNMRLTSKDAAAVAQRDMLLAIAYSRTSNDPLAYELFEKAYNSSGRLRTSELRSEIAYWWGRALVDDSRFEQARQLMPAMVEFTSETQTLRALHFRSTLAGREERYADQASALIDVLRYVFEAKEPHPEILAHATETLAALAREFHLPTARPLLERALEQPWPAAFARQRFQALKALGWICALAGDTFNAFRHLKGASEAVAGLPENKRAGWKTVALLDRAYLARCIGEQSWSRQELAEAEETAERVVWAQTQDERIALLLFAELFVHFDPGKSAAYLARYEQLADLKDPLLNFAFGPRMRAIADYASGVVHLGLGHRARGIEALKRSFKVFDRIGYDWRAGRSALRLYEVSRDETMLRIAREKLRHYAASWLGKELQAQGGASADMGLTPMQEAVFKLLIAGRSTEEIAGQVGRSKFTVRNHIKQLLKIFNVNSRPALLAEASRRHLR